MSNTYVTCTQIAAEMAAWCESAVSFATNGEATYHYPNPPLRTIGPFGSGATLKTDGEKIVGRVEAPAFRIGGVYRDGNGDVIELGSPNPDLAWGPDEAQALRLTGGIVEREMYGSRNLSDGKCGVSSQPGYTLLPGELVQRDGQWVAMEEAKPASRTPEAAFDDAVRRARESFDLVTNVTMVARDDRQPTSRERSVMARINLAKSLAADWEAAKKQPAPAHPYPFARNFQG